MFGQNSKMRTNKLLLRCRGLLSYVLDCKKCKEGQQSSFLHIYGQSFFYTNLSNQIFITGETRPRSR